MSRVIVPSKPFKSYEDIVFLAAQAKNRVKRIQVDICDGEYVKNISWPFTEFSKTDFSNLAKKSDLDVFMPEPYTIAYTADLMCANPEKYIDTLVQYGFDEIIIHWRSIAENPDQQKNILEAAENYSLALYIALDVKTNVEEVKNFFQKNENKYTQLAGIQVMGIENIGLQGQPFTEKSLEIVKVMREFFGKNEKYKILFDGAVNFETIENIQKVGVDVFCVGSALTEGDFVENLKFLKKMLD